MTLLRSLLGDAISSPLATASIAYRNRMSEFMTDSLLGPTERACLRMCEVVIIFREVMAWPSLVPGTQSLFAGGKKRAWYPLFAHVQDFLREQYSSVIVSVF